MGTRRRGQEKWMSVYKIGEHRRGRENRKGYRPRRAKKKPPAMSQGLRQLNAHEQSTGYGWVQLPAPSQVIVTPLRGTKTSAAAPTSLMKVSTRVPPFTAPPEVDA